MAGNQAGQSADEIARRTREKISRLERSVAAWDAGAAGERVTADALAGLNAASWRVLHDVAWPGRARANIDHVVIGPPGIFVIDSKNWSGSVAVKNGVLRQNGCSREKAVAGVAEAGIAVLDIVPDVPVHPVLCLVRDDPFEGWVRDVMLCSTANLTQLLITRPPTLGAERQRQVTAALERGLSRRTPCPGVPSRRPSASRRSSSRRSRRSGPSPMRLVGLLVMALLMLGALQSGLFAAAASKVSDAIVGHVFDREDEPAKSPAQKPVRRKDRGGPRNQG